MCKHWKAKSQESWRNLKSLKSDTETWGMEDNVDDKFKFKIIFGKVLKRCGKFLSELIFEEFEGEKVDREIIQMIIRECPNLKNLDVGSQIFNKKSGKSLEMLKPIFHRLKKCDFILDNKDDINDNHLKELFLLNQKMEDVKISCNDKINGSFIYGLPCETLKELFISQSDIPLHKIFNVSFFIFPSFFFFF